MNRINPSIWIAGALGLMLATVGGCAAMQQRQAEFFPADEAHSVDAAADAQANAGAKHDAMLRPIHFEHEQLNALGRRKLDRMIRADAGSDLTVYLALPSSDADLQARHDAVVAYLHQQGLPDSRITVHDGINPQVGASAHENLTRLPKTENPAAGGDEAASGQDGSMSTGRIMTSR